MSNYMSKAYHPDTGKLSECYMIDDYFGRHKHGVQFMPNGRVWRESEVKFPDVEDTINDMPNS